MQKNVIGVLMIYMLIGCSKQNEVPDSTTKLLHVIVESPNEELYHAQPTEIGIGTDVPDEEEIDATQKVVEEEKNAWDGLWETALQKECLIHSGIVRNGFVFWELLM